MVSSRTALRTYIRQHEPVCKTIQSVDSLSLYVEFANPSDTPTSESVQLYECKKCDRGFIFTLRKMKEAGMGREKQFPRTLQSALTRLTYLDIQPQRITYFAAATPQDIAKSYGMNPASVKVGNTNNGISKYTVLEIDLLKFASARQYDKHPPKDEASIELESYRNMNGCTYTYDTPTNKLLLMYRTGRISTKISDQLQGVSEKYNWLVAYVTLLEQWILDKATPEDSIVGDMAESQQFWPGEPEGWRQMLC